MTTLSEVLEQNKKQNLANFEAILLVKKALLSNRQIWQVAQDHKMPIFDNLTPAEITPLLMKNAKSSKLKEQDYCDTIATIGTQIGHDISINPDSPFYSFVIEGKKFFYLAARKQFLSYRNEVLCEDEHFIVVPDPATPVPGLFIIKAKRNVTSIGDMTSDELTALGLTLGRVRNAMQTVLNLESVTVTSRESINHPVLYELMPYYPYMGKLGGVKEHWTSVVHRLARFSGYTEENVAKINEVTRQVRKALK